MSRPVRLAAVMTHPIQYYAPWFRYIAANCPDIELLVHYCIIPSPAQQGVRFGHAFTWDSSLLDGYPNVVIRSTTQRANIDSSAFFGVNVPEVNRSIMRQSPDVVLVPGWYSVSLVRAALSSRMRGLPVLYRGDSNVAPSGAARRIRSRAMLRLFTHYLTVGARNRAYLRTLGIPDSRVFFAPHCVDNDFFARIALPLREGSSRKIARDELGLRQDSFVVLFAGKLEPKKHPWEVIHAAGGLSGTTEVVIAGSGISEGECREVASRYAMNVKFAGFTNQADLARLYGIADCLVLPSDEGESWGLVVNEALASGLPCIVSNRVGCAPDLIQDGVTGFVTPYGDVAAITDALGKVRDVAKSGRSFAIESTARAALYSLAAATHGLGEATRAAMTRPPRP